MVDGGAAAVWRTEEQRIAVPISGLVFSCRSSTRRSGLLIKGDGPPVEPLTIGTLLYNESGLGHPRLVTLSACETGRYDTQRAPEEFVGLPATFMQLGATGVLATLWQADDLATALLMTRTE